MKVKEKVLIELEKALNAGSTITVVECSENEAEAALMDHETGLVFLKRIGLDEEYIDQEIKIYPQYSWDSLTQKKDFVISWVRQEKK